MASYDESVRLPAIKLIVNVAKISHARGLLEPLFITVQVMTLPAVEALFCAKKIPLEDYNELLYQSKSLLARQMMEEGRALVPLLFPLAGDVAYLRDLPNYRSIDGGLNLDKMNLMMTVLLRLYCGNRDFLSTVLGEAALTERTLIPLASSPSPIDSELDLVGELQLSGDWTNRIKVMAENLPRPPK